MTIISPKKELARQKSIRDKKRNCLICFAMFFYTTSVLYRHVLSTETEMSELSRQVHVRPEMIVKKGRKRWSPRHPWDEPPQDFFGENDTGSFEDCTGSFTPIKKHTEFVEEHEDIGKVTVSCHEILYRAPKKSIEYSGKVIIGILSAAGGSGPRRRNYIRSTWGSKFPGLFFLVAGPWEQIQDEYTFYQDIIWIDEDEVYKGEDSVLTYKTMSYFAITHKLAKSADDGGFVYAIKTDDDSYVNIENIYSKLYRLTSKNEGDSSDGEKLHYFGQCPQFQVLPSRDPENKWSVSYSTYPEPKFPLYCQGAGFGLSRELLSCAENNIGSMRYQPFEDASIGMLAERCGYKSTMVAGVRVFRADTPKERGCVNRSIPMTECYKDDPEGWPPQPPNMQNILIQHRVETKEDMVNIHKSMNLVPDWVEVPNNLDRSSDFAKKRIDIKINNGVVWQGSRPWAQF